MTRDDRELIREAVCALGMAGLAIGLLLGLAAVAAALLGLGG